MSDREIIIQTLKSVDRRLRAGSLVREFAFGLSMLLVFLVAFKVLDFVFMFDIRLVRGVLVLAALAFGVFAWWSTRQKTSLMEAAAALDRRARLNDEIKSAYWFATSGTPATAWIEVHVRRAAANARKLNIERLVPVPVPRTSWLAAGLFALLLGLNFAPVPWNHNWLYSQPAPRFALSADEKALVEKTRELLKKAEKAADPMAREELEAIINNLEAGNISASEALQQLQDLQHKLEEGNLDANNISEGLSEMAEDLEKAEQMQGAAEAMADQNLMQAAEEMRKLAEQMGMNTNPGEAQQQMAQAMQEAAENGRAGLEQLAENMKEAAEAMKAGDAKGAQQAMRDAAKDLENLAQKMESQQLRNEANQQLQSLEDALRQRQNQQQQTGGNDRQEAKTGDNQQKGAPGQKQGEGQGQQQQGQAQNGQKGEEAGEPGQPGDSQEAGDNEGQGMMPSGSKTGSSQKEGAPTQLDVQLEMEKLSGQHDESKGNPLESEEIEEVSKQERSKLDYRNVRSELSSAQQDLLNKDHIPWEYRPLIKNYFQAIKPREKK